MLAFRRGTVTHHVVLRSEHKMIPTRDQYSLLLLVIAYPTDGLESLARAILLGFQLKLSVSSNPLFSCGHIPKPLILLRTYILTQGGVTDLYSVPFLPDFLADGYDGWDACSSLKISYVDRLCYLPPSRRLFSSHYNDPRKLIRSTATLAFLHLKETGFRSAVWLRNQTFRRSPESQRLTMKVWRMKRPYIIPLNLRRLSRGNKRGSQFAHLANVLDGRKESDGLTDEDNAFEQRGLAILYINGLETNNRTSRPTAALTTSPYFVCRTLFSL
jgi:hypothetical protein